MFLTSQEHVFDLHRGEYTKKWSYKFMIFSRRPINILQTDQFIYGGYIKAFWFNGRCGGRNNIYLKLKGRIPFYSKKGRLAVQRFLSLEAVTNALKMYQKLNDAPN